MPERACGFESRPGHARGERWEALSHGYHRHARAQLLTDLETLGGRLADDRLVGDLYRALADHTLHKRQEQDHLTLSWQRAEEIISSARSANALPAVEGLAQSGGEGALSDRAREILDELAWEARPLNTGRHDDRQRGRPESPPPADRTPPGWERQAHEEAEANRRTPPKL